VHVTGSVDPIGRIFCTDVRPATSGDRWDYEILLDTRSGPDDPGKEDKLWINGLRRHPTMKGLWEARVVGDAAEQLLRLSTDAAPSAMPTAKAREAASAAHERQLFPDGIPADGPPPG
jgi:hypothetical protein